MSFTSEPSPPTFGICGRPSEKIKRIEYRLSDLELGLIVGGCIFGVFLLAAVGYRLVRMRAARMLARTENTDKNEQSGYLPKLHQPIKMQGIATGGADDYIQLDMYASDEDGYYVGLPISIIGGIAIGESTIIEDYEGRQRRAYCRFGLAPAAGSKYEIGHATAGGMG